MTPEQAESILSMLERCHKSLSVLLVLAGIIIVMVFVQIILKIRIFRRVVKLLERSERVLKLSEIHGDVSDRTRERVIDATDNIQREATHVAKSVEETKAKLGDVAVKVDEIKTAVIDGKTNGNGHTGEAKP
jgi:signal transduction histidine kinase